MEGSIGGLDSSQAGSHTTSIARHQMSDL